MGSNAHAQKPGAIAEQKGRQQEIAVCLSVGRGMHSMNMKALVVSGHCICTTIVLLSYVSVTGKR